MFSVVAVYPGGGWALIGFARSLDDADRLIDNFCIARGGPDALFDRGIHFNVELVG